MVTFLCPGKAPIHFALIVSVHPYCAQKFTYYSWMSCIKRSLSAKINNGKGQIYSFAWIECTQTQNVQSFHLKYCMCWLKSQFFLELYLHSRCLFSVFMWRSNIPKLKSTFPSEVLVASDKRSYRNLTFDNVLAWGGSSFVTEHV